MLWCIAPVAPTRVPLNIDEVRHAIESANMEVGFDHKQLAAAMGFDYERIGLYYRQLRTHGLNLNLLINAGPRWWLAFIVRVCRLLGISQEQIANAFGLAFMTEEDVRREREAREAHDRAIDRRLRRLERLAGVPASDTQSPANDEGVDEEGERAADRLGAGRGDRCDVECVDGDTETVPGDRRPVQVPV